MMFSISKRQDTTNNHTKFQSLITLLLIPLPYHLFIVVLDSAEVYDRNMVFLLPANFRLTGLLQLR